MPILLKLFQKLKEHFQPSFVIRVYSDPEAKQGHHKKILFNKNKNDWPISLMNTDAEIPNKILQTKSSRTLEELHTMIK